MWEKGKFFPQRMSNNKEQWTEKTINGCWNSDRVIRKSLKSYLLTTYLQITKRKIIDLQGRSQANTTLTKCPKLTSLTLRHMDAGCLLVWRTEKDSRASLPKPQNLNLITRKHGTNPDWETLHKITGSHSSKMSRSQTKADELSWIKERDPIATYNARCRTGS